LNTFWSASCFLEHVPVFCGPGTWTYLSCCSPLPMYITYHAVSLFPPLPGILSQQTLSLPALDSMYVTCMPFLILYPLQGCCPS
jgi:hypothetical protein